MNAGVNVLSIFLAIEPLHIFALQTIQVV